jgi:hypothetical protein
MTPQLFDSNGSPTVEAARHAAQDGMKRALDHAEADCQGWGDTAMAYLHGYALSHERFTGWLVTTSAELRRAVPTPANAKAWGSVIQKAARLGIIQKDGFTTDPNRHNNPVPVWKSLVYREAA